MGLMDFFKKGVEKKVTPVPPPPAVTTPKMPDALAPQNMPDKEYTIASGDSLSKIAKRFYGDAQKWNVIYEANKSVIKNPDLIHPGQTIKIPNL